MRRALRSSRKSERSLKMFYVKSSTGEEVPVTSTGVFTHCPKCGIEHKMDLVSLIVENADDCEILNSSAYCEECSKLHLPMWERMDEIEAVANRFPDVGVEQVKEIIRSGLDRGFSFETALVGARLALAMQTGREELFTLDDVAAALGCTKEEASAEMERQGIQGMTISTLPGFEWLLNRM